MYMHGHGHGKFIHRHEENDSRGGWKCAQNPDAKLKKPPHMVAVYEIRRAVRHLHGISNRVQSKAD
ncbi:hypothetical protein BM1_10444 [Bipolaris maydis]|nr:hypothetical protein BM1_10444 [Bipolaris maydis]